MEYIEIINKLIRDINSACSESYEILRSILKSDPFEPYWKKREVVFKMPKDEEVE